MAHSFQKFICKVFVNGKFPKTLPSENFLLYGMLSTYLLQHSYNLITIDEIIIVTR